MKSGERIASLELIRALCSIGIVLFHIAAHIEWAPYYLRGGYNASYGDIIVTLFFILSGFVLYLNYSGELKLKEFYYKRFKSLMPMYYLAFLFCFLINVIKSGRFFYNPSAAPASLLLTIIGMDGYLAYSVNNYYILGEWFLGAIVLLYAAYPALSWEFNHHFKRCTVLVTALFLFQIFLNPFEMMPCRHYFSCQMSFYTGMILARHRNRLNLASLRIVCAAFSVFGFFVLIPIDGNLFLHLYGPACFITLMWIGDAVTGIQALERICSYFGRLSYAVFLSHHVVISTLLQRFYPMSASSYLAFTMMTLLTSVICAQALNYCNRLLLHSEEYSMIERSIM